MTITEAARMLKPSGHMLRASWPASHGRINQWREPQPGSKLGDCLVRTFPEEEERPYYYASFTLEDLLADDWMVTI